MLRHLQLLFIITAALGGWGTRTALAGDATPGPAPAGWFAFTPPPDSFSPSPIDLRRLNEKFAGEHGFIAVRGDQFVHGGTGEPIRFWGVVAGPGIVQWDHGTIDRLARFLAKKGVNLVRFHGPIWKDDAIHTLDADRLDHLFYFVAAMKKEGIYTGLSIYFPLWLDLRDEALGYTGQKPFGLMFFDANFQKVYRGWWRAVLATRNPYTQQTLAQDPAIAFVEGINEDSLMFWTFRPYETIPAPATHELEGQFGQWLVHHYGSIDQACANWGYERAKGDDPSAGRMGFLSLWQICHFKTARAQDTVHFLTDCQQEFFSKTKDYLKNDLHYQGCFYGSNWITADDALLGPLDKYSNLVGDFMDHHGYFGGPHEGPRAAYALSVGDEYADQSTLLLGDDPALPFMDVMYNGKPSIMTEINWPMPNRYRADLPLLCAGYGSLEGTRGYCFLALTAPTWESAHTKFGIQCPVIMGQFPAAALMYRQGMIRQAAPVVDAQLKLSDLFALRGSPVARAQNLDELRARDLPAGQDRSSGGETELQSINTLSFLAGRVEMNISPQGGTSTTADLTTCIDRAGHRVRSMTGELNWDYAAELVTVDAPQAQGATGFLRQAGEVQLHDVTIHVGMDYGAVALVSLDGQPLRDSGQMLLQVMSEDTNFGWSAPGEPGKNRRIIRDVGGPPIVVRDMTGSVALRRPDAGRLRVTALDFNGYPVKRMGAADHIQLRDDTLYYLIER